VTSAAVPRQIFLVIVTLAVRAAYEIQAKRGSDAPPAPVQVTGSAATEVKRLNTRSIGGP